MRPTLSKSSLLLPGLILVGAGLALGISGCTSTNPDFCTPGRPGCEIPGPSDDGGIEQDLGVDPEADLRGGDQEDLRVTDPTDLRADLLMPDLRPACKTGADCPSRVCLPGGACESGSNIVYVDNRGGACMGTHAGTQADPVCTTPQGLETAQKGGKRRIYVVGSRLSYDPLQIDGLTLSIYGPGAFVDPTANIAGTVGRPALRITGAANVQLVGLELGGSSSDVVSCQGSMTSTPAVEVLTSQINGGQGYGLSGSRCKASLRQVAIYNNARGGVGLDNSTQGLIENAFIVYNRGPGVRSLDGTLRVRFSTISDNGFFGTVGGVECASSGGSKTIEASIVVDNQRPVGGSQLSSSCRLLSSAFSESSFSNGMNNRFNANPSFVSATDFHLTRGAGSTTCCIDQLDNSALTSDVLIDYDGTDRPQGIRWDIGAHEVK